jgi:hypothetical protein
MRRLLALLSVAALAALAVPAAAYVPQTITVDGSGADWNQVNMVDNDTTDTEIKDWCTGTPGLEAPLDLGRIYLTNDANFLYVGFYYQHYCFSGTNVGIAIDVNGATGGTTDPFARKISWTDVPNKPDFVAYAVLDNHYQALYKWNTGTSLWDNLAAGTNALGIQDGTSFIEFKILLSTLNVSVGSPINVEWWMTQEGGTKPALDAAFSDTTQTSTPTGTVFDLAVAKSMDGMFPYTILSATDNVPPTVSGAAAVGFPLNSNKQFGLNTNKVDITFSEPVDLATAQATGNYALTGAVSRSIIDATRDVSSTNVVHLTLNSSINAQATVWSVTATGVKDLANNTIVANGTTNVGRFFIHNVVFDGKMGLGLCRGTFAPTDSFSIEGDRAPLTFTLTDNAVMYDANADSIYTITVPFNLPFDPDSAKGWADLQWKFGRKQVSPGTTQEYEGGGNRTFHMSTSAGASETVTAAWNNDDPVNFTKGPVDVIFKVNAAAIPSVQDSIISLCGSEGPLSFTTPGLLMKDDGIAPDQTAGDKIYTVRVTFPTCTYKTVRWKVAIGSRYECPNQGDREVYLNDALFSSVNPIVMPARGIDFCTTLDKAVTVVFKVNMRYTAATPDSVVGLMGDVAPLSFTSPAPAAGVMKDDGAGFDSQAADRIYTLPVTFAQGANRTLNFKYAINDRFECNGIGNRSMTIDDVAYSTGTPQIRLVNLFDYCSEPTGVEDGGARPAAGGLEFASLQQSFPNPAARNATVRFTLRRAGIVALNVYDVGGRRVRTLASGPMQPGLHEVVWDGRDASGVHVKSGIYMVELVMGGDRLTHRLVMTR